VELKHRIFSSSVQNVLVMPNSAAINPFGEVGNITSVGVNDYGNVLSG